MRREVRVRELLPGVNVPRGEHRHVPAQPQRQTVRIAAVVHVRRRREEPGAVVQARAHRLQRERVRAHDGVHGDDVVHGDVSADLLRELAGDVQLVPLALRVGVGVSPPGAYPPVLRRPLPRRAIGVVRAARGRVHEQRARERPLVRDQRRDVDRGVRDAVGRDGGGAPRAVGVPGLERALQRARGVRLAGFDRRRGGFEDDDVPALDSSRRDDASIARAASHRARVAPRAEIQRREVRGRARVAAVRAVGVFRAARGGVPLRALARGFVRARLAAGRAPAPRVSGARRRRRRRHRRGGLIGRI
eukprot:31499-Pelagococcus_subviridis.AAC.43